MYQAKWNGVVFAESDKTVEVDGNQYFPMSSLTPGVLKDSTQSSVCPYKGTARYFDLEIEGETNPAAVWNCPTPKERFNPIANYVAFWNGIEVSKV
jgi:uncharacterized protein (DUF427 family)